MYPDSIKEKYTSIVIAYNYLKSNYLKSNYLKSINNDTLAGTGSTPKDHNALKFINKIGIYNKDIDNSIDNNKFNEEFLKNI